LLRGAARDLGERRHGCSLLQALRLLVAAPPQIADARYPPTYRALRFLSRADLIPCLIISSASCFCRVLFGRVRVLVCSAAVAFVSVASGFSCSFPHAWCRGLVCGGGAVDLAGIRGAWAPIHSAVLFRGATAIRILLIWRISFVFLFHGSTISTAGSWACLRVVRCVSSDNFL
jgi:hypothetical protein